MPTNESRLKPPFEIPIGNKVIKEGYKGDDPGNFHKYFSIHAPEDQCVVPNGQEHITIPATLLTGKSKEDVVSDRIMITIYKNGCVNADLGHGVLRWSIRN